jgi:hypothetical protein
MKLPYSAFGEWVAGCSLTQDQIKTKRTKCIGAFIQYSRTENFNPINNFVYLLANP